MDTDFNYIKEGEFKRRNHLLEQFEDNGLEKAIDENEFNNKFGQGHQVFTMEGINKFVEAATKEGATDEVVKGIEDELKTLSKVVVKTESGYESRYVREVAEEGAEGDDSVEKGEEGAEAGADAAVEGAEAGTEDSGDEGAEDEGAEDAGEGDDSVEKGEESDFGSEIAKSIEADEE